MVVNDKGTLQETYQRSLTLDCSDPFATFVALSYMFSILLEIWANDTNADSGFLAFFSEIKIAVKFISLIVITKS